MKRVLLAVAAAAVGLSRLRNVHHFCGLYWVCRAELVDRDDGEWCGGLISEILLKKTKNFAIVWWDLLGVQKRRWGTAW